MTIALSPYPAGHTAPRAFRGERSTGKTVTQLVVDYIDRNYAEEISLRRVAEVFGYSTCHLTTMFRQETGLPITAWIIKRRILAAQRLLGEADVTVAAACDRVGFTDLCYFTRQFVRYVGVTPARFRSTIRSAER